MFVGAYLPGGTPPGQDRWREIGHAAVVLDGASSFTPSVADAGQYVSQLAGELSERISSGSADLLATLAESILQTANVLNLTPGSGPSSTVLIARETPQILEVLALGDSTAIVKTVDDGVDRIVDERLARVATHLRQTYQARLRDGHGYDATNGSLLRALQTRELSARNTPGGYWIAEAEPRAAAAAIIRTFPARQVLWCVLATDGAQRIIDHLDIGWDRVARMTSAELDELLHDLHNWEEQQDPSGRLLPRAKRHDDKTIVVWRQDHT